MKNKLLLLSLLFGVLFGVFAVQSMAAPLKQNVSAILQQSNLLINGQPTTTQSLNYKDTTYVSLRKISELLGAEVFWDAKTQTIKISSNQEVAITDKPQEPSQEQPPEQPPLASDDKRFSMCISPEMELMAGVLTQTDWIQQRGPSGIGNEYFRALQEFMRPYKDHQAVQIVQQLLSRGFTYHVPCAFICHLGSLPDLPLVYEYDHELLERGGGRYQLEALRLALIDLAEEASFSEFIAQWQPQFTQWVAERDFDEAATIKWLEDFTGGTASEFHMILSPAMFPGGGYSISINRPDGSLLSYQVIREYGRSTGKPEFHNGPALKALSLHEWGHCFVNPALDAHAGTVKELQPLFEPVAEEMKRQAYGNVNYFMYEQVVRGMTSLAVEEFEGKQAAESHIQGHEQQSFYLTRQVMEILRQYQAERDKFPTLKDFIPTLCTKLKSLNLAKPPTVTPDLGVFPGYFKNVDYSKPGVFLLSGEQTKANDEIRSIAAQFNNKKDLSTVKEIFRWMNQNLDYGPGEKFGRTSAQIIGSRIATGCTDYGLAFAALAREKGIPTVFVQTARVDWIQDLVSGSSGANMIRGHILVEIFVEGEWYLVDSTAGKLFLAYDRDNLSLCDGYYVFAKSIEVWDSGVLDERENAQAMRSLFAGFDPALYRNPKYDYIDLLTGVTKTSGDFTPAPQQPSYNEQLQTVVLGLKEPVELFGPKFSPRSHNVYWGSFRMVGEARFRTAAKVVLLCADSGDSDLSNAPSYILESVPELSVPGEIVRSYQKGSQRIVLVKAPTLERLMQMIEQLPTDILTKDYR